MLYVPDVASFVGPWPALTHPGKRGGGPRATRSRGLGGSQDFTLMVRWKAACNLKQAGTEVSADGEDGEDWRGRKLARSEHVGILKTSMGGQATSLTRAQFFPVPSGARSPRRRHPSAHRPRYEPADARSVGQACARSHPESPADSRLHKVSVICSVPGSCFCRPLSPSSYADSQRSRSS